MPCPGCSELVVFFRRKVMALDRAIIENGSKEERKMHIAEIITEFIDEGVFRDGLSSDIETNEDFMEAQLSESAIRWKQSGGRSSKEVPISQREADRFTKFELDKLDNPEYFRRHLG
ncbi:MAG: hypothetical protein COA73_09275 [Candidatus Hydrogenedentota bacterium]|nr:MAG: hypothetical protein COA73_09275 [Candidatus Hydrogenedentota bacterium]